MPCITWWWWPYRDNGHFWTICINFAPLTPYMYFRAVIRLINIRMPLWFRNICGPRYIIERESRTFSLTFRWLGIRLLNEQFFCACSPFMFDKWYICCMLSLISAKTAWKGCRYMHFIRVISYKCYLSVDRASYILYDHKGRIIEYLNKFSLFPCLFSGLMLFPPIFKQYIAIKIKHFFIVFKIDKLKF